MRAALVVTLLVIGCSRELTRPCATDSDCLQHGIAGVCLPSPSSGESWCAFEAPDCLGGLRWGLLAGDGLKDTCVAAADAAPMLDAPPGDARTADAGPEVTLTVMLSGGGSGRVVSDPAGIDCGSVCAASFPAGTSVTLSASADPGSVFVGWEGSACAGVTPCMITLSASAAVYARFVAAGDVLWSRQFGPATADHGYAAARDTAGNVIAVGCANGSNPVQSCGYQGPSGAYYDVVVAKLDPSGNLLWERWFGGVGNALGAGVATLSTGDVVVIGTFVDTIDFDGIVLTTAGGYDAFVAKLAGGDGTALWAKRLGGTGTQLGLAIAVDGDDAILAAGAFTGSIAIGASTLMSFGGSEDMWLAKLTASSGATTWAISHGGVGSEQALGVAVDSLRSVTVVGRSTDGASFGGPILPGLGGGDAFVAQYTGATGGHRWSRRLGGSLDDRAAGVAALGDDSIVAVGDFSGSADLGSGTVTSTGETDAFVTRLTPLGDVVWAATYGGGGADRCIGVAGDVSGRIIVTGSYTGSATIGGVPVNSVMGSVDTFAAKIDAADAAPLWVRSFGGSGTDLPGGIAGGVDSAVAIVGDFEALASFGPDPADALAATASGRDIFVVLVGP